MPHRPGSVGSGTPCLLCPIACGQVGSGTPATHRHNTRGQRVVGVMHFTATLLGNGGRWDSLCTFPHCSVALDIGTPEIHHHTTRGIGQSDSYTTLPHSYEAVGIGNPLVCFATPLGSRGQWDSRSTLPRSWRAMGNGTSATRRHSAWRAAGDGVPFAHSHALRKHLRWNPLSGPQHC